MKNRSEKLRTVVVRWDITALCNLKCLHCYNNTMKGPDLATSDALDILHVLLANGLRELNLSGREPTLRQDLPQIINWCHKHHVDVNLTTNGTLLDQSMLARFIPAVNMIIYSIDGARKSTHDCIRGPGNFRKTIRSIKQCRDYIDKQQLRTQLGISCTINRRNFNEITDIINLGTTNGIDFLAVNPTFFCGSASLMKETLYLSPGEIIHAWEGICQRYLSVRPTYDLHLGTFPMEARLLNMKYDLDLPVIQNSCSAGRSLYINPSGEGFPCYMIPPIASMYPEFNKYMKPWKIMTEPLSKAIRNFKSFIEMAHAHTQIDHPCCADCSERADCRPCPLIAMYDDNALLRCKLAERMINKLSAEINNSTVPIIKDRMKYDISDSIVKSYFRKGNYSSEKVYQINPLMKCIWDQVDGVRTIKNITNEVLKKSPHLTREKISESIFDFVTYFRKEGIVSIRQQDR
jgi:MoaA/NifB/PqqE/SkfB family radical SAM enzyme